MSKYLLSLLLSSAVSIAVSAETWHPVETSGAGEWFIRSVRNSRPEVEKFYLEKLDKLAPAAERAKLAEEYHRTLEANFHSNRIEDAAIEKALNWKPGDYTWFNNTFYSRTGCTSWIIAPDASFSGACIVQKNRDYCGQNLLAVRIFRSMPGRYKVITVNDLWSSGAGAVMNEKGLMIVQNDGSSYDPPRHKVNVGCIFILRYIAEHCGTLDEAVAMLKKFHDSGIARSSSFYLLADLNSGMIMETTANHYSCAEVKFAYDVRSNSYILPGMASLAKTGKKGMLNGISRRFNATEFLRLTLNEKGKIAPADLMKLARHRDPEEEKTGFRQICFKNSLSSIMFVPDRMHPEYLSAAFVAVGPQRHTVFLPIPMGLSKMPESIINGQWGKMALELHSKWPLDHNRLPEFETLENQFIREYLEVKEQARIHLLNNRRDEAVKLLDDLFMRQYTAAKEFMSRQLKSDCPK